MKINLILLVIIGFMVIRNICYNKTNTKESMANLTLTPDEIAAAISNLSNISDKLQAGNFTINGALTLTDKLTVNNRNLLQELDALNKKTINVVPHLTESGVNTVFASAIYCQKGLWTDGDTNDISVTNVGGIRDLYKRVVALENKTKHMWANDSYTYFNGGISVASTIRGEGEIHMITKKQDAPQQSNICKFWSSPVNGNLIITHGDADSNKVGIPFDIDDIRMKTQFITTEVSTDSKIPHKMAFNGTLIVDNINVKNNYYKDEQWLHFAENGKVWQTKKSETLGSYVYK